MVLQQKLKFCISYGRGRPPPLVAGIADYDVPVCLPEGGRRVDVEGFQGATATHILFH